MPADSPWARPRRGRAETRKVFDLIGENDDPESVSLGGYIAEKLEKDLTQYTAMLNNAACQSSEGNFPLIRQANEATAKLLAGALEVAADGRDWKIPYPDIPTYIMNYEQ